MISIPRKGSFPGNCCFFFFAFVFFFKSQIPISRNLHQQGIVTTSLLPFLPFIAMRKLLISKHATLVNNSCQIRKFLITDFTTFGVDFINAVTKWFRTMFVAQQWQFNHLTKSRKYNFSVNRRGKSDQPLN